MDWIPLASLAVVVIAALLHLERRLSRIETDVRWLREAHEHRREEFHGPH